MPGVPVRARCAAAPLARCVPPVIRTLISVIRTLISVIRALVSSISTLISIIRTLISSIRTLISSISTLISSDHAIISSGVGAAATRGVVAAPQSGRRCRRRRRCVDSAEPNMSPGGSYRGHSRSSAARCAPRRPIRAQAPRTRMHARAHPPRQAFTHTRTHARGRTLASRRALAWLPFLGLRPWHAAWHPMLHVASRTGAQHIRSMLHLARRPLHAL